MRKRTPPSPMWQNDQAIFVVYRWLTWGVTALWLLGQGQLMPMSGVLAATGLLTVLVTLLARWYIRSAIHTPAIMGLDIVLVVAAVIASGGWDSPFCFYASSSLVLPALLFGWLGGVMAGLSFVALNLSALVAVGMPPSDRLFEGTIAGLTVLLTMLVPPTFGALFALLVASQRTHRDAPSSSTRPPPPANIPPEQTPPSDSGRSSVIPRDLRRAKPLTRAAPAVVPLPRTAEPGVDRLRHVIFAPMPDPGLDFGSHMDILVTRFSQQTGITTRLSVIGRARTVAPCIRNLLIRLVQEALVNVQQHAQASSVTLTLRYDIMTVQVLVQDDGVGLIDGSYERPGLRSLRAMHYRVAEFGGRMDVFETEGGGVTVRATMPIE